VSARAKSSLRPISVIINVVDLRLSIAVLAALLAYGLVTGERLIIETHVDLLDNPRPAIAFYPDGELNHDKTNWCGPNQAALEAMLRVAGFSHTQVVYESRETYPLTGATPGTYGRMVMHAWR